MTGNAPNPRPVISLRLSPLLIAGELAAAIAILLSFLIIIQFWAVLPDRIPIHFGFYGQPDAWGDKLTIWLLPAVATILFMVLAAVSRYPILLIILYGLPRRMHVANICWRDRFWFS